MNEREAAMSHPPRAELMIVTGMSGAGRSTAANVLEDQGWYVVDNLPPQLLPDLAGLVDASAADVPRLAAVVDEVAHCGPVLDEPSGDDGWDDVVLRALDDEQRHPSGSVAHLSPRLARGVFRRYGLGVVGGHLV